MKLFRFVIASLLALVLVLSPALSYANSATAKLPAGFQKPSVGDVAKRIVSRSNVVNYAVVGLLGAVDWVLDPKNNQVIYNIPTGNYCSVNQSKDCVNTLEEAEKKFIRFYNNYARREVLRDSDVECQFEFRGSTTSIICNWGFPDEKLKFRQFTYHGKVVPNRISNEQVAEQIIKNAKAGHAESVDFVVAMSAEKADGDTADSDKDKEDKSNSDDANKSDIQKIDDKYLKSKGLNAHSIKEEFMGKGSNSKYDLYVDKKTGEVIIYGKDGVGSGIRTGYFIK